MKKTIAALFFCIALACVFENCSAENITLIYPSSVNYSQIFQINLTLINFAEGSHNVKIEVNNGSEDINKIWNGSSWISSCMSSCRYVYNAINTSISNSSIFLLNITSFYSGNANITVRIDSSSNTFYGYPLTIIIQNSTQNNPSCNPINDSCSNWGNCNNGQQNKTCVNTSASCINTTYYITQSCTSPISENQAEANISIALDWEEENIINGKEFNVTLRAYNLKNSKYAVKIWLAFENRTSVSISDRYDSNRSEWKSGTYYVYDFFQGPGDKTKDITLRIREDYKNYEGDANIYFKLKNSSEIETSEEIVILECENCSQANLESQELQKIDNQIEQEVPINTRITGNTIILGQKNTNSSANATSSAKNSNSIIYKSAGRYLKEYAPYAFSLLCIFIMALLLIDKQKKAYPYEKQDKNKSHTKKQKNE